MQFDGSITLARNKVLDFETYARTFDKTEIRSARAGYISVDMEERAEEYMYQANVVVIDTLPQLFSILRDGLMREVRIYGNRGKVVWGGFVNEMSLAIGPVTLKTTLTSMYNRIWVRYRLIGTGTTIRSTVLNYALSQSQFGIKEYVMTGGELASLAVADQAAQIYLNRHRMPKITPTLDFGAGRKSLKPVLTLECKGWMDTLDWRTYNQTVATGTAPASAVVAAIITAVGQFIRNGYYEANATPVAQVIDVDRRGKEIVRDISRLGDLGYRPYLCRVDPERDFYFMSAASSLMAPR